MLTINDINPVVLDINSNIQAQFEKEILEIGPGFLRLSLRYSGDGPFALKEVVLFKGKHGYPPDSQLYGEGYQKLSQYEGTFQSQSSISNYHDDLHYQFQGKKGFFTVYNLLTITPPFSDAVILLAFGSTDRFSGEFRFNAVEMEIILKGDDILVEPGDCLFLEEIVVLQGESNSLFEQLSTRLSKNNPPLVWKGKQPTGWCSWYCYGPEVAGKDITANINSSYKFKEFELEYIQIDDGYQSAMGDWLTDGKNFPQTVKSLCADIRAKGKRPALWIAPFIAEKNSRLLQEHPEFFVQDENGQPLRSDKISYGGWRNGPWYMLDGTHQGARDYLKHIVMIMCFEWGVEYLKLDANIWGALGGRYSDPKATRVEAYRRGMEAIVETVGKNCFILGCNAPMWPSIGLVHGMRITDDVYRSFDCFARLSREGLSRSWQHQRLWLNDPDCAVFDNKNTEQLSANGDFIRQQPISENHFLYHAVYLAASGGLILSGDDLVNLSDRAIYKLSVLMELPNKSAEFYGRDFSFGELKDDEGHWLFLLNSTERPRAYILPKGKFILSPSSMHVELPDIEKVWLPQQSGAIFRMEGMEGMGPTD